MSTDSRRIIEHWTKRFLIHEGHEAAAGSGYGDLPYISGDPPSILVYDLPGFNRGPISSHPTRVLCVTL